MIPMRSVEFYDRKRIRNSIRAFLEGEQNLRWIVGIVGEQKALAGGLLLSEFLACAGTPRYLELQGALQDSAVPATNV